MDCTAVIQNETACSAMQQSACNWNAALGACFSYGYSCASYTTEGGCATFKGQRSGNRCVWNAASGSCGRCVQYTTSTCPWPICGVVPVESASGVTAGCTTPENHCESSVLGTSQSLCLSHEGMATFNCFWDAARNACLWCGLYPNATWCATNTQCYWSANHTLCIAAVHASKETTDTPTSTLVPTTAPTPVPLIPNVTTLIPLPAPTTNASMSDASDHRTSWPVIGGTVGGAAALIGVLVVAYCCLQDRPSHGGARRAIRNSVDNKLAEQADEVHVDEGEDNFSQFDAINPRQGAPGIRRKKDVTHASEFSGIGAPQQFSSASNVNNMSTEDGGSNSNATTPYVVQQKQHSRQQQASRQPSPLTASDEGRSSATTAGSEATMMDRPTAANSNPLQTPQPARRPPLSPNLMQTQSNTGTVQMTSMNIPALYIAGQIPRVRIVGRGGSGTVYQCRLPSGELIAQKEIYAPQAALVAGGVLSYSSSKQSSGGFDHSGSSTSFEQRIEALQHSPIGTLLREVRVVESISHPNIVKHFGFVLEPDQHRLVLFSEYFPLGNLASMVQSTTTPMQESLARVFTAQITSALAYLHAKGVVHRDVKCDNVLLAGDHRVKLSDFGASKVVGGGSGGGGPTSRGAQTMIGTPCFMAPEVLLGGGQGGAMSESMENIIVNYDEGYGRRADVWSLGIAVLEMLECGKMPWPAHVMNSPGAILLHISDPSSLPLIPNRLSDEGKEFVKLCCVRNPLQRATCDELLQHPWLCLHRPQTIACV
jgi:serine/threonine protein kinase